MQDTTKLQSLLAEASKTAAGSKPPGDDALQTRLKEEYQAVGVAWNARVESHRAARIADQIATTTPPPGVDKRFMRGHLLFAAAPVWKQYDEAHYFFPSYQFPEEEQLCRDVEQFLAHIARHESALGMV